MEYHRTLDEKDSRFDSLIAPLEFSNLEVQEFVRDNVCAGCLGNLTPAYIEDGKYHAHCITCKADIMEHNFIDKSQAKQSRKVRGVAHLELFHEKIKRNGPKRTPEEILKELGF